MRWRVRRRRHTCMPTRRDAVARPEALQARFGSLISDRSFFCLYISGGNAVWRAIAYEHTARRSGPAQQRLADRTCGRRQQCQTSAAPGSRARWRPAEQWPGAPACSTCGCAIQRQQCDGTDPGFYAERGGEVCAGTLGGGSSGGGGRGYGASQRVGGAARAAAAAGGWHGSHIQSDASTCSAARPPCVPPRAHTRKHIPPTTPSLPARPRCRSLSSAPRSTLCMAPCLWV